MSLLDLYRICLFLIFTSGFKPSNNPSAHQVLSTQLHPVLSHQSNKETHMCSPSAHPKPKQQSCGTFPNKVLAHCSPPKFLCKQRHPGSFPAGTQTQSAHSVLIAGSHKFFPNIIIQPARQVLTILTFSQVVMTSSPSY